MKSAFVLVGLLAVGSAFAHTGDSVYESLRVKEETILGNTYKRVGGLSCHKSYGTCSLNSAELNAAAIYEALTVYEHAFDSNIFAKSVSGFTCVKTIDKTNGTSVDCNFNID